MRAAPRPPLVLALAASLLVAGCLASVRDAPPGGDAAGDAPELPRVVAASPAETLRLGLAWYADVPPSRVAPLVAEGFTPVPCFGNGSRADVFVVLDVTRYDALPGVPSDAAVATLGLLTCATPPDGWARGDANEPPWYSLAAWADSPEYRAAYEARTGGALPSADVDVQGDATGRGFTVSVAAPDGTAILEGRWSTPGVGVPEDVYPAASCEPLELRGRLFSATADGVAAAVDWNKTEATCASAAALQWPAESPVAEVLGASRPPTAAFETTVDRAEFAWLLLGALEK